MDARGDDAEVPACVPISSATYLAPILPATDIKNGAAPPPPLVPAHAHQVPQMSASGKLTRSQQSELEMARRRAQKAAQGKAANNASARRAKRRVLDGDTHGSDSELQQKLSTVTDEKEAKRLKRLLRNRVSAQQARERKKSYVATLEERCRQQEQQLADAEQRIKTLERETSMLRTVLKNMQAGEAVVQVVPSFASA